jgi:hypothetical protein
VAWRFNFDFSFSFFVFIITHLVPRSATYKYFSAAAVTLSKILFFVQFFSFFVLLITVGLSHLENYFKRLKMPKSTRNSSTPMNPYAQCRALLYSTCSPSYNGLKVLISTYCNAIFSYLRPTIQLYCCSNNKVQ